VDAAIDSFLRAIASDAQQVEQMCCRSHETIQSMREPSAQFALAYFACFADFRSISG
jgi:hypothetical protein